jgi:hypothetical protein
VAATTVFVDDAVLGRLPPVCTKTGAPTCDRLVVTVPVARRGGLGPAWLLVLAGPLGWIILLFYAMVRRDEILTVRLPYSDAAYGELTTARSRRRTAGIVSLILFVAALFTAANATFVAHSAAVTMAAIGLGLLIACIEESLRVRRAMVGIELDGSRRWVHLTRVSDAFAAAIEGPRQIGGPYPTRSLP